MPTVKPQGESIGLPCHPELAPTEHLENDTWHDIAQKYLQAMGFDMNQYVVVRIAIATMIMHTLSPTGFGWMEQPFPIAGIIAGVKQQFVS